ncbi:hypothetical protein EMGBS8_15210 [Verrucomicrobiota bacterium]|nr:hypothetical protein EMGBS8_15210 [Verrucomicrobiota bacterium]
MPVTGTGITAGSVIASITPGVGITLNKETPPRSSRPRP